MPGNRDQIPIDHVLSYLEKGSGFLRFGSKRPEHKYFKIRKESHQLIWYPVGSRNTDGRPEGTVNLLDVKDIRRDAKCQCKDFDKWAEETSKLNCFVIYYGSQFVLKTISLGAKNEDDMKNWDHGLQYLLFNPKLVPYPLQLKRWLKREFFNIENISTKTVELLTVKNWLSQINSKKSISDLKRIYQSLEEDEMNMNFEKFTILYSKLVNQPELNIYQSLIPYMQKHNEFIDALQFRKFLENEQHEENLSCDMNSVENHMRAFSKDNSHNLKLIDYLYSPTNSIFNSEFNAINQNMDRPLTDYWINSSHNTYLTGNQLSSESSVEAYAKVLQMGCRCIELDCWDGPDGKTIIYHGYTRTTKIQFIDVLKTIKRYAFIDNVYPIILSIENHCCIPQQRYMASKFKEILGNELLTSEVDVNADKLPSPNDLKRKFIIKHRKMNFEDDRCLERKISNISLDEDVAFEEILLKNSDKNGFLYLEDPIDKSWSRYFVILAEMKLYFPEESQGSLRDEFEDDNETNIHREDIGNEEGLHIYEKWFHGRLDRNTAEQLIRNYPDKRDGSFLVRISDTFVGDYSLTFWRCPSNQSEGSIHHARIRSHQVRGQTKYYLTSVLSFASLHSCITYYQSTRFFSESFNQLLTDPVPPEVSHLKQEWYYDDLSREEANSHLSLIPKDGAFLVRKRHDDATAQYVISFRALNQIRHCKIKEEGRLVFVGTAQFEGLVELVQYYRNVSFYKKVKLIYPVSPKTIEPMEAGLSNVSQNNFDNGADDYYWDPLISKISVKAINDFHAQNSSQLSFSKDDIITNVSKLRKDWWLGDVGNQRHKFFPSNHVEDISNLSQESPFGNMQRDTIDVDNATIVSWPDLGDQKYLFRIVGPNQKCIYIGAPSEIERNEWILKIREISNKTKDKNKKQEQKLQIAKELSDLVVYCRCVTFSSEKLEKNHLEMCSLMETKVEKFMTLEKAPILIGFNEYQLSRVYPRGKRFDSSNYDEIQFWHLGCHMCALNFQTADKSMDINQSWFLRNGGCGFVLKPQFMLTSDFNPYDLQSIPQNKMTIDITIFGARHLPKSGRSISSPFVEIQIIGISNDNKKKQTKSFQDNGLNPIWNEVFTFEICCPELAMIRFVVYDTDHFEDAKFLCQNCFPLQCIKQGYRSVQLKNGYGYNLELASLLVQIDSQK